ncbi:MAG: hypothetical protein WA428_01810 [Candidatus Cybelea sp.]
MRSLDFMLYALSSCVAAAMLAGCGGSQPPIGAPGAMPQTSVIATHAGRGTSWILPEAKNEDLIYATGGCGGTCVLSYPAGKLVGSLDAGGDLDAGGGCVDGKGDVFIPDNESELEYAHGGSEPIATLELPGGGAGACSIDSTTGNLAVIANFSGIGVAIFANAKGAPTIYGAGILPYGCGYDNQGNLFVSGENNQLPGLSELPAGASYFTVLTISKKVGSPGQVQWDGKYIAYEGVTEGHILVSRLSISGSAATIVGTSHFNGIRRHAYLSWIYDDIIIIPYATPGSQGDATAIGIWKYPGGGKFLDTFKDIFEPHPIFQGVTLSAPPGKSL